MKKKVVYYQKYTGLSGSIFRALEEIEGKAQNRKNIEKIAKINDIEPYTGTVGQNLELIEKLKAGTLVKRKQTVVFDTSSTGASK